MPIESKLATPPPTIYKAATTTPGRYLVATPRRYHPGTIQAFGTFI